MAVAVQIVYPDSSPTELVAAHMLAFRRAAGATQTYVADAMGCSQTKVSRMERGVSENVKVHDIRRYLNSLGMDVRIKFEDRKQ